MKLSLTLPAAVVLAASYVTAQAANPTDTVPNYTETYATRLIIYNVEGDPLTTVANPGGAGAVLTSSVVRSTAVAPAAATTAADVAQGGVAAGGGGGTAVTLATLQVISGYNPPPSSVLPSPTAFSSGSILNTANIPGWSTIQVANSGNAVVGGGGNKVSAARSDMLAGRTSGAKLALAGTVAAAVGSLWMVL